MLIIKFPAGAYSANKDKIKEVFKILEYKYAGSYSVADNKLICNWKRKVDNKSIKAIFNGSGQACDFIIDCKQEEIKIFNAIANKYNSEISEYIESTKLVIDIQSKAKSNVDKWFTYNKQQKGEPDVFYKYRQQKERLSYQYFIDNEIRKLKQTSTML